MRIKLDFAAKCKIGLWYKGPELTAPDLNVGSPGTINGSNTELAIRSEQAVIDVWMPYIIADDGYNMTVKSTFTGNMSMRLSLPQECGKLRANVYHACLVPRTCLVLQLFAAPRTPVVGSTR